MAHFNLNASVPKTLVKYLVAWLAEGGDLGSDADGVLRSILNTEISPELVPSSIEAAGQPAQRSEEIVGPFELADFFLYYLLRYGYHPSRVAFLAHQAWGDEVRGQWPDLIAPKDRRRYHLVTVGTWLAVFLRRFVETSQLKRSTLPNGPKVGSGGSLSPRGDWRAPSDASAAAWLDELERNLL